MTTTAAAEAGAEAARQGRPGHHRQGGQARRLLSLQRPGVGVRHDRQGRRGVLRLHQRQGRRRRPQDQLQDARRRLRASARTPEREAPDPAGQGLRALQHAGHPEQPRDLGLRQPAEGAAALRRDRRLGLGQGHQGPPVHDRLAAELRHRGQGLRRVPEEEQAERQGRRPLPERRLRQGPARRLRGGDRRLRHQGRRQGGLQRHRPDRLGPDGAARRDRVRTRS